jgi:Kef-type K+ transport system membrane component KefB
LIRGNPRPEAASEIRGEFQLVSTLACNLRRRLSALVTVLLLPAFFALVGMRMEIGLLAGLDIWLLCGLIVLAATLGQFGGTVLAGRMIGITARSPTDRHHSVGGCQPASTQ